MAEITINPMRWFSSGESKKCEQAPERPSIPADVPENAHEAYEQARYLVQRSPRASGALCRYCIQQMVRDFWQLSKDKHGTLASEFAAIDKRLAPETRESIKFIRQFGSIESHLDQDRDMMVETSADEAKMLIVFVKLLAQDWYVERRLRKQRLNAIRSMVDDVTNKSDQKPNWTPEAKVDLNREATASQVSEKLPESAPTAKLDSSKRHLGHDAQGDEYR